MGAGEARIAAFMGKELLIPSCQKLPDLSYPRGMHTTWPPSFGRSSRVRTYVSKTAWKQQGKDAWGS